MQITCRRSGQARLSFVGLLMGLLGTGGCRAPQPAASGMPATTSATTTSTEQTFRTAEAKDLKMLVATQKPGADGFPVAVVQMWNASADEVLVEYQPGSVVLHCGPYEQTGPANVFGRHREVLDPQQELDFELRTSRWSRSATTGPRDLMLPTELPKGKYELWATFRMPGCGGGVVESDRDAYEVP
jgi:hypothetical protein